ncbi:DUF4468 domain-containing protein [Hymenobacter sp. DG01]|uniref:DUF4468 domain-containing protein n=1 Tax=Hymenobacter sp. DG01 TaxID=2584940 RepID=UPI0015DF50CD|nr:DUF4468 domain-containing protein [Hymenobacter sp. DG01]
MKNYLLLAALLGSAPALQAQTTPPPLPPLPLDSATHKIAYRGTLVATGVPAAELYGRTREWTVRQFEDARQVVQLDDPARGVLMGRGVTLVHGVGSTSGADRDFALSFLFRLRVSEGRCTYEITDLSYYLGPDYARNDTYAVTDILSYMQQWQRTAIATMPAQNRRAPLDEELTGSKAQASRGYARQRLIRDGQGVDNAVKALLLGLAQELRAGSVLP